MSHIPVLIVGAGPSGLMMACELARHQIAFRIIDKKPERTQTSNAAGIQTRTLELFDHLGILHQFIRAGLICKGINITLDQKPPLSIRFDEIDSLYPFILMLPQAETERLLIAHLESYSHHVERPLELVAIQEKEKGYLVSLKSGTGETQTLTCDWLVSCDGAHSVVRDICKVDFKGEDIHDQFVVADAVMDSFLPNNEMHIFNSNGLVLATFPLGQNKYRLAANMHLDYPRQFYTEKEVKEIVIERGRGEFNVQSLSWISPFWIHSKMVDQLKINRIFFVGDCAHIHSPVGGQGMNTGIQDAYNLAWKLALVINRRANVSLLESYQAERYPVIKRIVNETERMTKIIISEGKFFSFFRNLFISFIRNKKSFLNKIANRMTQLSITYEKSPVICYQSMRGHSPAPGARAPDILLQDNKKLHDYFKSTKHSILLFSGTRPTAQIESQLIDLQKWLTENYALLASSFIVTNDPALIANSTIYDANDLIHKRYDMTDAAIYIIRPDHYIGAFTDGLDKKIVDRYFKKLVE